MGRVMTVRVLSIVAVALFLFAFEAWLSPMLGKLDNRLIILALLFATLSVSLNLINGITGQFSIGHAAFYQVGAYATGFATIHYYQKGAMPDWLWLLIMIGVGAIAAGIAGWVVGLPSLRLRGDYLAVVTLGFGEIIRIIIQNQPALGGSYGLTIKSTAGDVVKITPIWVVLLLFIVCIAVCRNMLKTAHGLQFLAVREDELAASAMGVNTTRTKVTAFVIGAAFAGMAGALFSHYEGFITPKQFSMDQSFLILAMVVIGGTGSITGAAISGIALTLLPEALRDLPNVPAISLLAFLIAAILLIMVSVRLRKRINIDKNVPLAIVGILALAAAAYATRLAWGQTVPTITKIGVTGAAIGLIAAMLFSKHRATALAHWGYFALLMGLMVAVSIPFRNMLESVPLVFNNLKGTTYEASNLRLPFFATMLVLIMLSRPQGLFGHHEFSWSWVKSLFGKQHSETAVAA